MFKVDQHYMWLTIDLINLFNVNHLIFFKQQILLKNQIPAQDEQRLVKLSIQTKGAVYRRNTQK